MKMKNLFTVLAALMFFTSVAAAQPANQSQTQVDPGFLPGNPFYALENFVESLEIGMASAVGGSDMKAKALANNAEERLAEARALSNSNNSDKVAELVQNYDRTMNRSMDAASKRNNPILRSQLQNMTQKNVEVLEEVKSKVPEQAKDAIQKAIDRSNRTPQRGPPEDLPGKGKAGKENSGVDTTPGKSGELGSSRGDKPLNKSAPGKTQRKNLTNGKMDSLPENRSKSAGNNSLDRNLSSQQERATGNGSDLNSSGAGTGSGTGSGAGGSTGTDSGGSGVENPAETVTDSQGSVLN